MGPATENERNIAIKENLLYSKYYQSIDSHTAYESLKMEEEKEEANQSNDASKGMTDEEYRKHKALLKEEEKAEKAKKKAAKSLGTTVATTVGREVGKQFGKGFGSFGKTFGGNVGASMARGLFSTLFKL